MNLSDFRVTASYWAEHELFDPETRREIRDLIAQSKNEELKERFYRNLEFGTGGLRGVMGAGSALVNVYNIRRAAGALGRYLNLTYPRSQQLKVAIAYDSRLNSQEFAREAALTLAGHGIEIFITKELRPVPFLSFMVRYFKADAGICITASHNPPEYNGFKVYWRDGGQLVPPHDRNIMDIYESLDRFESIPGLSQQAAVTQGLYHEVGSELDEAYFLKAQELSLNRPKSSLKILYSALHGAGSYPVKEVLRRYGFRDVAVVAEQNEPDGRFPTVSSPNPEDPRAMALALAQAPSIGAELIMATDPDADRLGVIVKEGDKYLALNGNQMASLLTDYILSQKKAQGRLDPQAGVVMKTIVTTDLMAEIAASYGVSCEETLTGFKWIGEKIESYEQASPAARRQYICGGEESYGFLVGTHVRDKDAVSTAALFAEMCAYLKDKGSSPLKALEQLYLKFGYYEEALETLTLKGLVGEKTIKAMMKQLRAQPFSSILGIRAKKLMDYATQRTWVLDNKSEWVESGSLNLPSSDVLQWILEDGTKLSVRPSGTEPKIKFYFSVRESFDDATGALERTQKLCQTRVEQLLKAFVDMAESVQVL